jgi:hypothetical protein
MKRPRNHQIDTAAQLVFREALPLAWVINEHGADYAKDYLVEIGNDDDELTGSSFYVQLKGQQTVSFSADGTVVKFQLKAKYAIYYSRKIKDLPVFLVVVDVTKKKGWWLFLQRVLAEDLTWDRESSITLNIPVENEIGKTSVFQKQVEEAKNWLRVTHPLSVQEAVFAQKRRIAIADPRFNVEVSLENDEVRYKLLAKEEVPLTFTFLGDNRELRRKIEELFDKGGVVSFAPGEIAVAGSKLFEHIEKSGCSIQAGVNFSGSVALTCQDGDGRELARLLNIPGHFTGGHKEFWFEGRLENSPLTLKLGPIAAFSGGSLQIKFNMDQWDGQKLTRLAYFDRLNNFVQAHSTAAFTKVECEIDGNTVFTDTLPRRTEEFWPSLRRYFQSLANARKVAHRFNVSPTWTFSGCDRDALETGDQLYAIFFESGWSAAMPNATITTNVSRTSYRQDLAPRVRERACVNIQSDWIYTFFGERLEIKGLVHQYTDMVIESVLDVPAPMTRKSNLKERGRRMRTRSSTKMVEIALIGSERTMVRVWFESRASAQPVPIK